jgi:20S proteasome subunit alpha 7
MSAGYDIYCTTLSQEGRIYQLEYAEKAVESGSTCMGIIFSDGVILLSEKIRQSKAIVYGSNPTIYRISPNIEIAICGLIPDGRNIISRAKLEASSYLKTYGIDISGKILTERLSIYVHAHTCHWSVRPFGCCVLISSFDKDGKYHLFMLENSGNFFEYFSCAHGKGRQFVKAEVEKDNFKIRNLNVNEGLEQALKIIIKSYEGEKETEYDIGIISNESKGKSFLVDKEIVKEKVERIKKEVKEEKSKMDVDK